MDGFRDNVRLMPHQIKGTVWMKSRESGKKNGGILADVSTLDRSRSFALLADGSPRRAQDMGLGKTVQTLARIVDGRPTSAHRKAGYRAGTL